MSIKYVSHFSNGIRIASVIYYSSADFLFIYWPFFRIAPRKMKLKRWHQHKSTQHRLFNPFQLRRYVNCDCRNTLRLTAQFTSVNTIWKEAESKVSSIGYLVSCRALWSNETFFPPSVDLIKGNSGKERPFESLRCC